MQLAYLLGPFKQKPASFLVTCHLFCFPVQSLDNQRCGTPASITQGRFTVNSALIYFQLGHKDRHVPAGKHLC